MPPVYELDRCIDETKDYDENGEFLSCVLYKTNTYAERLQRILNRNKEHSSSQNVKEATEE